MAYGILAVLKAADRGLSSSPKMCSLADIELNEVKVALAVVCILRVPLFTMSAGVHTQFVNKGSLSLLMSCFVMC